MKPRIAVTLGDPASIGPEIVARVCSLPQILDSMDLVVVGQRRFLDLGAAACGLAPPRVEVLETGGQDEVSFGNPGAHTGRLAGAFIEKAFELCASGEAAALATAPIAKEALNAAGYAETGHTTLLARLCGGLKPVMMLGGERLKVVLATIHKPLREVPRFISKGLLVEVAQTAHKSFQRYFAMPSPRIAVCGLNPHAGEGGMFGEEEREIIAPAVAELQKLGVNASGPFPPDTVFWRAVRGEFDLVLCQYHDQGLIPLKLLHFEDAVNVTLGLPIIRTSVDHGTAFDLAGQGVANHASLVAAVELAASMARAAARAA